MRTYRVRTVFQALPPARVIARTWFVAATSMGFLLVPVLVAILLLAGVSPSKAAGRVQLEIVGSSRGDALVFQQWLRALSGAGIKSVRIRSGKPTDKIGIEVRGSEDSPLYVVTGVLQSNDELRLPGAKFKRSEAAKLARWLDDLAKHGPVEKRETVGAFGMTGRQFEHVRTDLSQPVDFPTENVLRSKVVSQMIQRLTLPTEIKRQHLEALEKDNVAEDLVGLSSGTALACVLRPAGLCLVPHVSEGGVGYTVVEAKPKLEIWPIGWKPKKPRREVLPTMFEFLPVNIQGVSAQKALEAIAKRMKVPVLMDHNAMARHGIEPEKVIVSLPRSRTTYGIALRKILFQAGLKSELRVDEAGQPLLWISTVKPI